VVFHKLDLIKVLFYILVTFNLHEGEYGKARMFVVPARNLYQQLVVAGGLSHGTKKVKLMGANLSMENIKGNDLELSY
jgi:hypothetical protein